MKITISVQKIVSVLSFVFIILFSSCSDENSIIGLSILPESDRFEFLADTLNVDSYTLRDTKITTDRRTLSPLGSFFDPEFGFTKASFACHIRLSSANVDFSNVQKVNSLELRLRYKANYGDTLTPQIVKVYRLKKKIYADSTYYDNFSLAPNEIEFLSQAQLLVDPADTLVKIQMPQSLVDEFINPSNKPNFVDNDKFIDFFNGLYVTTENVTQGGAVYVFDLLSNKSNMVLTYNDSLNFSFLINNKCAIINMIEHDYSSASERVKTAIQDSTQLHEFCFIQSLAGLKVKINFPEVSQKFTNGIFAINRAQLVINVEVESVDPKFAAPPKLTLVKIKSDGTYDFVTDYKINNAHFGGDLNKTNYQYIFNIPFHIQELVNGTDDYGLYLFSTDNRTYPYRCVIYGTGNNEKSMKLRLLYSAF
ncbi:MAG: DUF4270 family protein [Bacteroidales bacterium]